MAERVSLGSRHAPPAAFERAAREALGDALTRRNVERATSTIRAKRAQVVAEVPDWRELRAAGGALKRSALLRLDELVLSLEASVTQQGGTVHWARNAREANAVVVELVQRTGATEVVKVKSLTTDELGLNDALHEAGITPLETDLAELIVQLADERPSHLLVPALHRSRAEIRDLFREHLGLPDLGDDPHELAEAARRYLRAAFLRADVAISGANLAVAETGTVAVVESEGNGRMCTTLPRTLITVMGVEKVVPEWRDLGVILQLLPRSATGERMNPYTTLWSGVSPGDGPSSFHLVLVDAGRTRVLADPIGRDALRCIRCSACINVCPVYRQTGGHAYHTVYAGPIGAILAPQLGVDDRVARSLPFASSLCGACADVCPVEIDIPALLVNERTKAVARGGASAERTALRMLGRAFSERVRYERAQRLARAVQRPLLRRGRLRVYPGPLGGWGQSRELPGVAKQTFREWWDARDAATSTAVEQSIRGVPVSVSGEAPSRSIAEPAGDGSAREVILGRIRRAVGETRPADVPREYRRRGALARDDVVARFTERVEDYRGRVIRTCDPGTAIEELLAGKRVGVTASLDSELLPRGAEVVVDGELSRSELERLDAALTTCAAACADTGTIALAGGVGEGRRALSLVPDLHVCVVREAQIVETFVELVASLEAAGSQGRPIVLVSGPSATSDIELERVEGVHGPRTLVVVLVNTG